MEAYVLDTDLKTIGVIDNYNSFIWTERYAEAGDFEINMPASAELVELLKQDRYLRISDSNEIMIIEGIAIKTENNAPHMTVTGRSLVSILDRRVILGTRYFNAAGVDGAEMDKNVWQIVSKIVDENAITPESNPLNTNTGDEHLNDYNTIMKNNRKINSLQAPDDSYYNNNTTANPYNKITDKKPKNIQFNGETLYDAVKSICDKYHLGFAISDYSKFPGFSSDKPFVFYIYDGQNRTSGQKEKPADHSYNTPVILSPLFQNVANISYASSTNGLKTILLAAGEESGKGDTPGLRPWAIVDNKGNAVGYNQDYTQIDASNEPSDLELREAIQDISSEVVMDGDSSNNQTQDLNDEQYAKALINRAFDILNDSNKALDAFDGELVNNERYKVKRDYDLGDIIEMSDGLGHSKWMRVTEIIYSHNNSGYKIYPTLALYEKDQFEQNDET